MIRLYELRTEKGLSQRDAAKIFDISQPTYNNWENSRTEPSLTQLIELSQFFGVSVDYLIGNSDELYNVSYSDRYLSNNEKAILELFKVLPDSAQKNIIDFIRNIRETE